MADLTVPLSRKYGRSTAVYLPVAASTEIFAGMGLERAVTGEVSVLAAAGQFAGFAMTNADNSGGAAGDLNVQVVESGIVELTVAASTAAAIGDTVFANDSNTFDLTATTSQGIGSLYRQIGSGSTTWEVKFNAAGLLGTATESVA